MNDTHHDSGVLWAADNRGEHSARSIISCETSFAHARAVVDYERLNFLIIHD